MDFILRKWKETDAQSVQKYANNKKIADNLRDGFPYPYTLGDAEDFTASMAAGDEARQLCRAIEVAGEAAGSIGVFLKDDVYRKSAEIGYWLAEPYWGQGIMAAAIRQMCAMAFEAYGIVRIFAEPYAPNVGSRRALEKAGFRLEGVLDKSVYKNGELLDSCIYALVQSANT